jgi:5-methylcytosine-specific restriction endonuclease McrA
LDLSQVRTRRNRERLVTRPFAARYPGKCAYCSEPIEPGDEVVYDEDELVHHACTSSDGGLW